MLQLVRSTLIFILPWNAYLKKKEEEKGGKKDTFADASYRLVIDKVKSRTDETSKVVDHLKAKDWSR